VQVLALEYLRYADGLKEFARAEREETFRKELLEHIAKAGLASTGEYKEDILFQEYFPEPDDDEIDFTDNSGVEFEAPTPDEVELLAQMLANNSVTVDGAPLEGPGAIQVSPPEEHDFSLPPPRDFDPTEVDQDTEWV